MVERFLEQTAFTSQEDFIKNLKIKVPENFNFGMILLMLGLLRNPTRKPCCGPTIKVNPDNTPMAT